MLDIGFWEMAVIGVVALIVVRPEDFPSFLGKVGDAIGRFRIMSRQFRTSLATISNEIDDKTFESNSIAGEVAVPTSPVSRAPSLYRTLEDPPKNVPTNATATIEGAKVEAAEGNILPEAIDHNISQPDVEQSDLDQTDDNRIHWQDVSDQSTKDVAITEDSEPKTAVASATIPPNSSRASNALTN